VTGAAADPVVVIGAGLAGLAAARWLTDAGRAVVLLDKGRSVGGRMATRRVGTARLDHGAQFFTVRSDELAALVEPLRASGLVTTWCHGFGDAPDGHPRFAVQGGMNALAQAWATSLDVRTATLAFAVRPADTGWRVDLDDGRRLAASAVVITTPVPQARALLVTSGLTMPDELAALDYDRTLTLLAVLDRPPALAAPGGRQHPTSDVAFVADNVAKGVSATPAVTLHAAPAWSLARWDADAATTSAELVELARPHLGDARVVDAQVKRWRFATPQRTWPDRCWSARAADGSPVVLAGDAFAGPRVEGAVLSGAAAAAIVIDGR
jgi:predicted NAD/FAD-dependent oxidoreductase